MPPELNLWAFLLESLTMRIYSAAGYLESRMAHFRDVGSTRTTRYIEMLVELTRMNEKAARDGCRAVEEAGYKKAAEHLELELKRIPEKISREAAEAAAARPYPWKRW